MTNTKRTSVRHTPKSKSTKDATAKEVNQAIKNVSKIKKLTDEEFKPFLTKDIHCGGLKPTKLSKSSIAFRNHFTSDKQTTQCYTFRTGKDTVFLPSRLLFCEQEERLKVQMKAK